MQASRCPFPYEGRLAMLGATRSRLCSCCTCIIEMQPRVLPRVPYLGERHWQPFGFAQGRLVRCEALGTKLPIRKDSSAGVKGSVLCQGKDSSIRTVSDYTLSIGAARGGQWCYSLDSAILPNTIVV